MISVIIVAGGKGSRMGATINKVYLEIAGQPVLMHTIEAFLACDNITECIVVYAKDDAEQLNQLIKTNPFRLNIKTVLGGHTRTESVKCGLLAVSPNQRKVLIHDGARPLVSRAVIERVVDALEHSNAVVPTVPVTNTIKKTMGDQVLCTVDRNQLSAAQTPQGFDKNLIDSLYRKAADSNIVFTDDASVVEHFKLPVRSVMGDIKNIKLTTPFDLKLAEVMIKENVCE